MPFTAEGITPDIVINPHAISSRTAVGHLVECLLSKTATLIRNEGDATPFTELTVEAASTYLRKKGYQSRGLKVMHHDHSGKNALPQAQVYLGPTYYQRLKHMVDDLPSPSWARADFDQAARGGKESRRQTAIRRDGA